MYVCMYIYMYICMYIYMYVYFMPWKFVCDLWFDEVLQTTIIRQITKGNESFISFPYLPYDCFFVNLHIIALSQILSTHNIISHMIYYQPIKWIATLLQYIYIFVLICIHMHIWIYKGEYIYTYMYTYMYKYIIVNIYVYIYV